MEALVFTSEQRQAYKQFATGANEEQYSLFLTECERRRLIPGVHVVFQLRPAKEYSKDLGRQIDVKKVTLITTINALRLIAERSGKFRGYGKFTYYYGDADGNPTIQSAIPFGKVPHAVSVELFREGWQQPVFAVARYDAYVQTKSDNGKDVPTRMWRLRGEEQLAKCAEALGLRMVAPEECAGLYIEEEFQQETKEQDAATTQDTTPVVVPQPTVAPPVNQAPAQVQKAEEPAAPATPAPAPAPKPAAAPAPKPTAKPVARPVPQPAKPATPPPAPAAKVRQPVPEQEVKESPAELAEFADRVARDTTETKPVTPPNNPNITDEDLPEILQPKENPTPAPAAVTPIQPTTAAQPAATDQTDKPATDAEYKEFVNNRAAKIVRDKLEKGAGLKNPGPLMMNYLLRASGKDKLKKISAATFERLISALETATPEQAAQIVKG